MESTEFRSCVAQRGLKSIEPDDALSRKELDEAHDDLKRAGASLKEKSMGWAVVQAYYACFHAAKALVISRGYTEKSHACLAIAFRDLFEREGLVAEGSTEFLDELRGLREDFNYGLNQLGEEETNHILSEAEAFVAHVRGLFKEKKA